MIYITKNLDVVFRAPYTNKKCDGPCVVKFESSTNKRTYEDILELSSDKCMMCTLGVPNVFLDDTVPSDEASWITQYVTLSNEKRISNRKNLTLFYIYNPKYNKSVVFNFSFFEAIGDK